MLRNRAPAGWRALFAAGAVAATVSAACGERDEPGSMRTGGSGGSDISSGLDAGVLPGPLSGGGGTAGNGGRKPDSDGSAGVVAADAGMASAQSNCVPGETLECVFDQLCTGTQTCGSDGAPGPCQCGATALVGSGIVGARCTSDADCGSGTCFRADSDLYLGAGGPAGGYCTFSCTRDEAGGDDCATHDPQSFCAPIGPDRALFCQRTCLSLDPEPGEAKCLNRPELVCISPAAGGGMPFDGMRQLSTCEPLCGSDADCPIGRSCHAQAKICTVGRYPGEPIGAACSVDRDCSGDECENRIDGVGVCTAPCVLGALSGCGFARDDARRGAACLIPKVAAGRFSEGAGDRGFCRELCDLAEDCEQAAVGWTCTPLNAAAVDFFGRSGACVPPP